MSETSLPLTLTTMAEGEMALLVTNDGQRIALQQLEEPQVRWVCDQPRYQCSDRDSVYRRIYPNRHASCGMAVVRKFADIGIAE